ncbi:MAG: glucose 1-dehydrogenase [Solirubrobacterales bacterium]|nr:glucose 1-dehydrogenase [Solirubrobacterales bacterium]MBV9046997.1 glucose 1-dehydrogenase [Solirubrobacterales bacterium]
MDGKVALVTGAAGGMGHAIADLFASEGARVVATDVQDPQPPYGDGVRFVQLDVTDEAAWRRVVDEILEREGRLDVLINNAGVIAYEPLHELDLDEWQRVVSVNQGGVFLGMREVVPAMRRSGGGSIVNFSSIWGNVAVPGAHAYHATKGAVRNMSKNAALTYAEEGIRVNSVHPGFIDTPLTQAQAKDVNEQVIGATPMKRAGRPEEVAYGCLFLASDEASFVTGSELVIDGGYLAQ